MTSDSWLSAADTRVDRRRQDHQEAALTVAEAMVHSPKVLPPDASLNAARAMLNDEHVHLVLLSDGRHLVGTLTRDDLPPSHVQGAAMPWSTLLDRTVGADLPAAVAQRRLVAHGVRRLAVVDDSGGLLGLLCLKRSMGGFCSDSDVEARASDPNPE